MPAPRSRFSRRHLLALCSFLVPLAVLAVLGQSELQRRGVQAEAAIEAEARQFLRSAAQALEQRLDRQVTTVLTESERTLVGHGPVRAALDLREDQGFAALLDVVLLDEQVALVWPSPPPANLGLPLAQDPRSRGSETAIAGALQAADLLLTRGDLPAAQALLEELVSRLDAASSPEERPRRTETDDLELTARFRLATVARKRGDPVLAREQFERVRSGIASMSRGVRLDAEALAIGFLAEAGLAELGSVGDRVKLLRAIAESRRDLVFLADGLQTAVAERLHAAVPADDPQHAEATGLLREERQRAHTRNFAGEYDLLLKESLRRRLRQSSLQGGSDDAPASLQLVSTVGTTTSVLCVRAATAAERQELRCARVGLRLDLGQSLAPVLQPFFDGEGNFVLAMTDPEGVPVLPAPTSVPAEFAAPTLTTRGLTLLAYPADAARLVRESEAAARNRTLLVFALFAAALGGALWLWRSVSREAELAALKVELVSRVSHELKTPLALIRMYGETLGMGRARDADQAAHFGGIIARESERLTTLIQRILDFSRQQAGTLQYAPGTVDLAELLRAVADAYLPHLEAKGAVVHETLQEGLFATCDANACESAVVNLLENAVKYGNEGPDLHEIDVELRRDGDLAVIEVRDRGRGIPPAEIERVFDGFYRASNSGDVRGAGLGLSLVRHFARSHGGDATAAPRDGGGTVMRLTLPLCAPPAPPAAPAEPDRSRS